MISGSLDHKSRDQFEGGLSALIRNDVLPLDLPVIRAAVTAWVKNTVLLAGSHSEDCLFIGGCLHDA